MDPILSRKLFRQKALQTHKPLGFRTGAILDFKEIARQRSPGGITQLAGGPDPNNLTDPIEPASQESKDNINRELEKGFDKSANQTVIEPEAEVNSPEQKGISSVIDSPEKLSAENKKKLIELAGIGSVLEKSEQIVKKPASEPLFSDSEKKGIFAAQLAMALAQPGDAFANLGIGLSKGAMTLADLKATEAEIEDQKTEFSKTKKAIDSTTNKPVFVTEAQIQSVTNPDGSARYTPEGETAKSLKIGNYLIKQPDGTYKPGVVPQHLVAKAFLNNDRDKYLPYDKASGETIKTVRLNRDFGGKKKGETFIATESDILKDLKLDPEKRLYGALQLSPNAAAEALFMADQAKERSKKITTLGKDLDKAESVTNIIVDIKKNISGGKIKMGSLGAITQIVGKASALKDFVIGQRERDAFTPAHANYSLLEQAINDPKGYAKREDLTGKVRDEFLTIAKMFDNRMQDLTAETKTLTIELAFAVAKAREEGGRFSVSDIKLAMESINAGLDSSQFESSLNALGKRILRQPLTNYRRFYQEDEKALGGEQYQFLREQLEVFEGIKKPGTTKNINDYF